jgi:hypothetical protein
VAHRLSEVRTRTPAAYEVTQDCDAQTTFGAAGGNNMPVRFSPLRCDRPLCRVRNPSGRPCGRGHTRGFGRSEAGGAHLQQAALKAGGIPDSAINEVGMPADETPVADESGIDAELWKHLAPEIRSEAWGKPHVALLWCSLRPAEELVAAADWKRLGERVPPLNRSAWQKYSGRKRPRAGGGHRPHPTDAGRPRDLRREFALRAVALQLTACSKV